MEVLLRTSKACATASSLVVAIQEMVSAFEHCGNKMFQAAPDVPNMEMKWGGIPLV